MEAIREAEKRIQHYREYQGFHGQTGDAIKQRLDEAEQRLEEWRSAYLAATLVEVEMRRVMHHARERRLNCCLPSSSTPGWIHCATWPMW